MEKLKPCPFCGSEAEFDKVHEIHVSCSNHGCPAYDFGTFVVDAQWNKRIDPWISVDDALPEDDIPVLVYFGDDIDVEIDYCTTGEHYGNTWFANDPDRAVLKWQPFTKPTE